MGFPRDVTRTDHDERFVCDELVDMGFDPGFDFPGIFGHWGLCDTDGSGVGELYL